MTDSVEKKMKLFVAGELSGDPAEWSEFTLRRAFVLAESEDEARSLVEFTGLVCEVRADCPTVLR